MIEVLVSFFYRWKAKQSIENQRSLLQIDLAQEEILAIDPYRKRREKRKKILSFDNSFYWILRTTFAPFSCFLALHAGGHYQLKLLFGLVRCQSSCWQNRHFCAVFCSLKIMADSFFIKKLHHMLGPLPTAKNDAFVRQMQNTFCKSNALALSCDLFAQM